MGAGSNGIIFDDFDWPPNPGFKVTVYLQVEYLIRRYVLGAKLLKNTNRKPYTIYRMVPLSMTLSDLCLKDKVTIAQKETTPNIMN